MKPITEKFEEFALISGQIPLLRDVLSAEQLTEIIEGRLSDKLTDQVYYKMSKFPFHLVKKAQGIVSPVRSEIDLNFISIENNGRLERYLKSIDYKVWSILGVLETLSYMETLKNRQIWLPKLMNSVGNKYQIVYDFLNAYLTLYNSYSLVQMHVNEKLNDIESNSIKTITEIKEILLSNTKPASLRVHSDILTHRENSELSAFEIALRHWYLVEANIEDYIIPKHVGEKYKDLANYKNIEISFGDLDAKPRRREPNIKNLNKVKKSLIDFPEVQKAIENDIDKLS